ncbi:hypothetical protein BH11PSE10_BH11PSE10_20230 [soil metagenome]
MKGAAAAALPPDLVMLERGWLSSNSLLMLDDPRGAVLVDTGYCTHKAQTLLLVQTALGSQPLRLIVNTHLHSDHCGGNAHLSDHFGCPVGVPPGHFQAAVEWDQSVLSFDATGQNCERFTPALRLEPGSRFLQSRREWHIHAAPGHDAHSVLLFEPESGVLMSADALWEHGFGIVFPELDGEPGFDDVEATLDLIASLPARIVIPGHGSLFTDVAQALVEAHSRLAFFKANPRRHARHAAKALLKYRLLEVQLQSREELLNWLRQTPIHQQLWRQFYASIRIDAWSLELIDELVKSDALRIAGNYIHNS